MKLIRTMMCTVLAALCGILTVSAADVRLMLAPATGDAGMGPILIIAVVGVVLVAAFVALTAIQKKRKQNTEDDDQ